jgi:hypothetical protein
VATAPPVLPVLMETITVVRLLEEHGIHADRGRVWRITEALALNVRETGSHAPRRWTADQARLVLLAAQLKVRRGLSARTVHDVAAGAGRHADPTVNELRDLYRRVSTNQGLVVGTRRIHAAA